MAELINEKYLRSSTPTEQSDKCYGWVVNELYQYLLTQRILTLSIYEKKDSETYLELISSIVKKVPCGYYDIDLFHDWTLRGNNNGFMNCLRSAYSQFQKNRKLTK